MDKMLYKKSQNQNIWLTILSDFGKIFHLSEEVCLLCYQLVDTQKSEENQWGSFVVIEEQQLA